ncbi:MAG TPA: HD domain-containing phosphohydrolase, partial [Thermoleophilaceae bacterium]|nr:HD domain-containing phosphohydrolase [Thermoleophilaceae bacterium]
MERPRAGTWFATAAIAVAVGLVLVVVLLLTGALFDSADDLVTVFLAGVAVTALVGWWQDKAERAARDAAEASERERADRERHEEHMREVKTRTRLERAHIAEKQWARELRSQVARLHKQQGALGNTGDVREMVLQTAVKLVDADRGLLLSRRDDDNDGDFDMACQVGFESDATHSAVAQEYAGKVLRRDETVREDDSRQLRGEGRNPADDEIDNLLAIPIFIQDDFEGVVLCANREGGFEDLDDDVLLALGDHAGAVLENGKLQGEVRSTYMAIVRMLAEAIEAKDPATRLHSEDVAEYVRGVADGLGLEARHREELLIASLLHDVGKIGVSERILLKPGALTPDERAAIELHSRIGYHLVRQVPALHGIADAV